MFKALFKLIFNLLATIIQVVCLPLNLVVTNALPDLTTKINQVTNTINDIFSTLTWALGLIPDVLVETLLFIVTVEIAKHTIFVSTHTLTKIWTVIQKLKFW